MSTSCTCRTYSIINSFDFKVSDLNSRPEKVIPGKPYSFKQKGAQVYTLLRTYPIMFGSKVPEGNRTWEGILLLKELVDYVMCPKIARSSVELIGQTAVEALDVFKTEFDEHFTPKMHFILHYESKTYQIGPLVRVCTERFESKHTNFIEIIQVCRSKRNVALSCAKRHSYHVFSMHLN